MVNLDTIPMVSSPNRTVVMSPARKLDLIVIHDMEAPELDKTAENVAAYFGRPATKASAHYCVDRNSIVQCVAIEDVAWAAPGANHNGIQIEYAGYAAQSLPDWNDAYSSEMLRRGAELTAALCKKHNIPVRFVNAEGLLQGRRGITTHAEVSKAFKKSTHTDPGSNFPVSKHISDVLEATLRLAPVKQTVTFQILNNGYMLAESAVCAVGPGSERLRLDLFLNNRIGLIQKTLAVDPDSTIQIKRKVT